MKLTSCLILLSLLFIYSCQNEKKNTKPFSLSGNLKNAAKGMIYLQNLNVTDFPITDSTYISIDGNFAFNKPIHETGFYTILCPDKNHITLLLDTTEQIKITGDLKNFAKSYKIEGSPGSNLLAILEKSRTNTKRQLDSLGIIFLASQDKPNFVQIRSKLTNQVATIEDNYRKSLMNFIDTHLSSLAIYWALSQKASSITSIDPIVDFNYYVKVDSALFIHYPKSAHSVKLHKWVSEKKRKAVEDKMRDNQLSVGMEAPDFSVLNADAKSISLASLKGKSIIINFWGSKIDSCRLANRILNRINKKYKSKGIEIFSVSFDKSQVAWLDACQMDGINWTSGMAAPDVAKLYNIKKANELPVTYLIDKDGKIVLKRIPAFNLEAKLKDIYKF